MGSGAVGFCDGVENMSDLGVKLGADTDGEETDGMMRR